MRKVRVMVGGIMTVDCSMKLFEHIDQLDIQLFIMVK